VARFFFAARSVPPFVVVLGRALRFFFVVRFFVARFVPVVFRALLLDRFFAMQRTMQRTCQTLLALRG
jgi:hypothetical protein